MRRDGLLITGQNPASSELTAQTLLARIQSIILKPRPFIRTDDYFGPDRRRTVRLDYAGPYRRSTDPRD